jgi:hypothetical protein
MGDVVNLNKFRKKRKKAEAESVARENRTRFGRTKHQHKSDDARKRKNVTELDQKKLQTPTQADDKDGSEY